MENTDWFQDPLGMLSMDLIRLTNRVTNELQKLNEILSVKKDWWETIPAGEFLAFVFGAFLLWFTFYRDKKKMKADEQTARRRQLNSALVSFDSTTTTLLSFKNEFIIPCMDNISKVISSPDQETTFNQIITIKGNSLLKIFPSQIFDETSYAEKLSFMANYRPEYLHTFHKIRELLNVINYDIDMRNDFIRQRMTEYSKEGLSTISQRIAIDMLGSFGNALNEHVDSALAFIKFGAEHIADHAQNHFPKEEFYQFRTINTSLEKLMPVDNFISAYREQIKSSIKINNKPHSWFCRYFGKKIRK